NRTTCISPRILAGTAVSNLVIAGGSFIVIMLCLPGCSQKSEQVSGQGFNGTAQPSPGAVAPTGQPESVVQGPRRHSLLSVVDAQQEQMQQEQMQQEQMQQQQADEQRGQDMSTGSSNVVTTPTGLQFEDLQVGNGPCPKDGQLVTVHYTGWLTNGAKFDSS